MRKRPSDFSDRAQVLKRSKITEHVASDVFRLAGRENNKLAISFPDAISVKSSNLCAFDEFAVQL